MKIAFYGDSLTAGFPGVGFFDILNREMPQHTLVNYGRGGDTALSLYRRIVRRKLLERADMAFLWIGTNDVLDTASRVAMTYSRLMGQIRAGNAKVFEKYYRALLDLLCPKAGRIVTVSPVFIGEDVTNPLNTYLANLSSVIKNVSADYDSVEYLDLRSVFVDELGSKPVSNYAWGGVVRVVLDTLTLQSDKQVNRVADRRGLHFTLDGVHFNSAGAALVAKTFAGVIRGYGGA